MHCSIRTPEKSLTRRVIIQDEESDTDVQDAVVKEASLPQIAHISLASFPVLGGAADAWAATLATENTWKQDEWPWQGKWYRNWSCNKEEWYDSRWSGNTRTDDGLERDGVDWIVGNKWL